MKGFNCLFLLVCSALSKELPVYNEKLGYSVQGLIHVANPIVEPDIDSSGRPKVHMLRPSSGPARGMNTITVIGENFGMQNSELLVTVGGVDCLSSEWMSSTAVRCTVPKGSPGAEIVRVLVNNVCSEDGPGYNYLFSIIYKMDTYEGYVFGGNLITLTGEALASKDTPINVFVGDIPCLQSKVVTENKVTCIAPPARITNNDLEVSVSLVVGSNIVVPTCQGCNFKYKYLMPTVIKVSPTRGPSCGNSTIDIFGKYLIDDSEMNEENVPIVNIGGIPCSGVKWIHRTQVRCVTPPSNGPGKAAVSVSVKGYKTIGDFVFDYDPPTIISIEPPEGPSYGGDILTIHGHNFGYVNNNINVFIAGIPCRKLVLVNSKTIECEAPPIRNVDFVDQQSAVTMSVLTVPCKRCGSYKYLSAVVESVFSSSGPVYGGSPLFIKGRNFGIDNSVALIIMIGKKQCLQPEWISSSEVHCITPASFGPGTASLAVTIDGITSSIPGEFTYESPIIESVHPRSGGADTKVTITGRHFGNEVSLIPNVLIGNLPCLSISIEDDTELSCIIPPGHGPGVAEVTVDVHGFKCLVCGNFAYGTPSAHHISPISGPSSGGTLLTINGLRLEDVVSVQIGDKICTDLQLVNSFFITCVTPSSSSTEDLPVLLFDASGSSQTSEERIFFHYLLPTVIRIDPDFAPSYGNTLVNITGLYFGLKDSIVRAFVGGVECMSTTWLSGELVQCLVPPKRGCLNIPDFNTNNLSSIDDKLFEVSVCVDVACGNLKEFRDNRVLLSYLDPIVDNVEPRNVNMFSSSNVIHIQGKYFGQPGDLRTTAFVGELKCLKSTVIDENNMECILPPLSIEDLSNANLVEKCLTVNIPQGSCSPKYSVSSLNNAPCLIYHHSEITSITPPKGAAVGGTLITITGKRLGSHKENKMPSIFIGDSACILKDWNDEDTQITCVTEATLNGNGPQPVGIFIDGYSTTPKGACFTYQRPVIHNAGPLSGPVYGGNPLTIHGLGFADLDDDSEDFPISAAVKIVIGNRVCSDVKIVSNVEIVCNSVPAGIKEELVPVRVLLLNDYIDSQSVDDVNNVLVMYSYIGPKILNMLPSFSPFYGNETLILTGYNLGNKNMKVDVLLGSQICLNTQLVNSNQLLCNIPPCFEEECSDVNVSLLVSNNKHGDGLYNAVYDVGGDVVFTYLLPIVSAILPNHGSEDGGTVLNIVGEYLGVSGATNTHVLIGGSECGNITIISPYLVTCITPAGVGENLNVVIAVAGESGMSIANSDSVFSFSLSPDTFSFDGASLIKLSPTSGPIYGGNTITIFGTNFGANNPRRGMPPYVFVNKQLCIETIAVDDNTLQCVVPDLGSDTEFSTKVQVNVLIGGVFISSSLEYSYENIKILSISPNSGPLYGNNSILIEGLNIGYIEIGSIASDLYYPMVLLGGLVCSNVVYISNTTLSCTAPPHPLLTSSESDKRDTIVDIMIRIRKHSSVSNENDVKYEYKYPEIYSVNPSTGPFHGGSRVEILGANLGIPGLIVPLVLFGDIPAESCLFGNNLLENSLICVTPNVPFYGSTDLNILIGQARIQTAIEYTFLLPMISNISPNNGSVAAGTIVTIQGLYFSRATQVIVGDDLCLALIHHSETRIDCTVPFTTSFSDFKILPSFYNFDDLVFNNLKKISSTRDFYITSFSPVSGSTDGFYSMNVIGVNFPTGDDNILTIIFIGKEPCMNIQIAGPTSLTCLVPPGVGNNLEVTMALFENEVGYLINSHGSNLFFNYNSPVIDKVKPDSGSSSGGYVVSLIGSNLGVFYNKDYYESKLNMMISFVKSFYSQTIDIEEIHKSLEKFDVYNSALIRGRIKKLQTSLRLQQQWLIDSRDNIEDAFVESINEIESHEITLHNLNVVQQNKLNLDLEDVYQWRDSIIEEKEGIKNQLIHRANLAGVSLSNLRTANVNNLKKKVESIFAENSIGHHEADVVKIDAREVQEKREEIEDGFIQNSIIKPPDLDPLILMLQVDQNLERSSKNKLLDYMTSYFPELGNECMHSCFTDDIIDLTLSFYLKIYPGRERNVDILPTGAVWLSCIDLCKLDANSTYIDSVLSLVVSENQDKCLTGTVSVDFDGQMCSFLSVEKSSEIRCLVGRMEVPLAITVPITVSVGGQLSDQVQFSFINRFIRKQEILAKKVEIELDTSLLFNCNGESLEMENLIVFINDTPCELISIERNGLFCNLPEEKEMKGTAFIYFGSKSIEIKLR